MTISKFSGILVGIFMISDYVTHINIRIIMQGFSDILVFQVLKPQNGTLPKYFSFAVSYAWTKHGGKKPGFVLFFFSCA